MNLSMKWLRDYVKIDVPVDQYAADMTMSGSKVESYRREGKGIRGLVIGKVLDVAKHPNADSLYICKVDVGGDSILQIVTGADNVVPGAMVPVFTDGSATADGKIIKKGKLRGEVSEGMLASIGELGLAVEDFPYATEDGIFLLEEECEIGQDGLDAIGLNDTVVEFEITPNRPDCLSVLGLARETAALFKIPFLPPEPKVSPVEGGLRNYLSVKVENPELCLRYTSAAVKNVKIGPSPRWMRERLRASGVRPINNIVDITNYVMLEYGQPMHAFDLKHVGGNQIIVRNAKDGERITTLDGVEHILSAEMLVIADENKPTAVAGVMGGEFSGVYHDTQTVIFESACFFGPSVRRTAKTLGMRTESSSRFEKGLDPANCLPALKRALQLVEILGAGEVVDGIIDEAAPMPTPVTLKLDPEWISKFLGVNIPRSTMEDILRPLGFIIRGEMVTAPSFRADVKCGYDLAEEVARFYGYGNIPATTLRGEANASRTPEQKFRKKMIGALIFQGLYEIVTYSFISPKSYDMIRLPVDSPLRESVVISNPLGEDTGVMRTTAIPSMLDALSHNYRSRSETACLFELATEYLPTGLEENALPNEMNKIVVGMYGPQTDFFALKGVVEAILGEARIDDWSVLACKTHPTFHPGRCAVLIVAGEEAGVFGQVYPEVAQNYRIDVPIYLAHLDFNVIMRHSKSAEITYKQLPRFPASTRDLALVCDESVTHAQIAAIIEEAAGKMLESLSLFDIYRSDQIGSGKKSMAYSLVLRASDRTLTDEECDKCVAKILRSLEKLGVVIRS